MDPLGPESDEVYKLRKSITRLLEADPIVKSIHDFQILENENEKAVEFHLVIDGNKLDKDETVSILKDEFERFIKKRFPNISFDIIIDIEY